MKNSKKMITRVLALVLVLSIVFTDSFQVKAMSIEEAGEKVEIITEAALEAYEASVIARMIGRAGASSPKGAHGIAFEIIYKDSENLKNFLCIAKPKEVVRLSESSIDKVADLVVFNSKEEVVGLIQCKDSTEGISKILRQVMDGQYDDAKLVGTKECAKAFNKAAEKAGIDARMIDSGISHEFTKEVAEKALGFSLNNFVKTISKSAAKGGAFCGALAAVESKVKHCSDAETFSNTTAATANGAISTVIEKGTCALLTAGLITESSGALAITGVFVAGVAAGTIAYKGLEKLEVKYEVKKNLENAYDTCMTATADFIVDCQDEIEEKSVVVSKKADKAYRVSKKHVDGVADEVVSYWAEKIKDCGKIKKNIR